MFRKKNPSFRSFKERCKKRENCFSFCAYCSHGFFFLCDRDIVFFNKSETALSSLNEQVTLLEQIAHLHCKLNFKKQRKKKAETFKRTWHQT